MSDAGDVVERSTCNSGSKFLAPILIDLKRNVFDRSNARR
jgi:hypothetical protein